MTYWLVYTLFSFETWWLFNTHTTCRLVFSCHVWFPHLQEGKLRLGKEILQIRVSRVSAFSVGQAATVLPFKIGQGHATLVIKVN